MVQVGWKVKGMKQFCFFMEALGSERRLLGNRDYSQEKEVNWC